MSVCDPTQMSLYASDCHTNGANCPSPPNPYCPNGTAQLQGTGFDVWDTSFGNAGATPWLSTQAPVTGGAELTLRFALWDGGDDKVQLDHADRHNFLCAAAPASTGAKPTVVTSPK